MIMSKNNIGETFLIDTFEGLIESENYHNKSHFVYKNINAVKSKIKNLRLKNTTVLKGKFLSILIKNLKIKNLNCLYRCKYLQIYLFIIQLSKKKIVKMESLFLMIMVFIVFLSQKIRG